ncbi:hypothetical protein ACNVED_00850 [Legionella sp. D16C41]|uniref:hypothetical protein n=1 Tax=Legionella sp. D16C41 TaxID=3402688 RepID=UPI003AF4BF99
MRKKIKEFKELPQNELQDYPVMIEGNDPDIRGLEPYRCDDNISVGLVATSGMRSLELACQLSAGLTKLIIIDNSRQVIAFWRKTKALIVESSEAETFLQDLRNYVKQSKCGREHLIEAEFDYLNSMFQVFGFSHLKKIITNATIIAQSWADDETMRAIKEFLADEQVDRIYAYVSNIVAHTCKDNNHAEADKILQNIQNLNPAMAIHTDLVSYKEGSRAENYILVTDHTPTKIKQALNIKTLDNTKSLGSILRGGFWQSSQSNLPDKSSAPQEKGLQDANLLAVLVKKYSLPDTSQASLEKGLRKAAYNNQKDDVKSFILTVKNINAIDTVETSQKSALHLAAIKGHKAIYDVLVTAGANPKLQDAEKKTPESYMQSHELKVQIQY